MTPRTSNIARGGFIYMLGGSGGSGPSLSFDFTTGVLPGAITFTRPSIGTYLNNAGTLVTASSNVARFNYVGGVACLLIEPSATNLLIQSNNFSDAAWTMGNSAVVTAAQFVSPDGTNNGWSETTGATNGYVSQTFTFSNIAYAMSIWAKRITGSADSQFYMNGTSLFVGLTTTLTRISGTGTITASAGPAAFFAIGASGNTNGIYGCQMETGSVITSYIPTTTAAVTRAADSAVFTIPAGIGHLTYTFDDNSTQTVAVSPGSYTVPTNLNRPNIKNIVGSA